MNITDELRKWARQFRRVWVDPHSGDLTYITNEHACPPSLDAMRLEDYITAIADRIDAEHEKAIASVMNDALYHANEKDMAELGWVHLPVDADGKSIHVGDKLTHGKTSFVVEHIDLHHWGWRVIGDGIDGNGCECTAHAIPDDCHHHAPTVEDVLRDMHMELDEVTALYVGEAIDSDERDRDEARIFAKYASKLRLAGEDA